MMECIPIVNLKKKKTVFRKNNVRTIYYYIVNLFRLLEYCSRGCFSLTCSDNVLALNNTIHNIGYSRHFCIDTAD